MFEEKRQNTFSKKHEEKRLGTNASEQDFQIEISTVRAPMHQVNAIEVTNKRNNYISITTVNASTSTNNNKFSLIRDEETEITAKVRNADDVIYDSVLLSIDKAKRKSAEKAKEVATGDINPAAIAAKKDAQDIALLLENQ